MILPTRHFQMTTKRCLLCLLYLLCMAALLTCSTALTSNTSASPSDALYDEPNQGETPQLAANKDGPAHPNDCWTTGESYTCGNCPSILYGVAAISPNDVWATGIGGYLGGALMQHWDGAHWSAIPTNLSIVPRALGGAASDDVWASGENGFLHWNGTRWKIAESPRFASDSVIAGLSVIGPHDIWAAGEYEDQDRVTHALLEHWDGTQWSIVPGPDSGSIYDGLNSVSAASANDVWAVGWRSGSQEQTLIEHWDGEAWHIVSSPNYPSVDNVLNGVTALSPYDVYAAGTTHELVDGDHRYKTLIEHWNGLQWGIISSPNPGGHYTWLNGIAAVAPNNIWAVGAENLFDNIGALALQGNSSSWGVAFDERGPPYSDLVLNAVAADSAHTVWAVGSQHCLNCQKDSTLIVRISCAPIPSATPQPTASVSPSRTPTLQAGTATVTTCSSTFSDVTANSAFYPFIRCLACRNIVGGYADGTFRPNATITRGQLAKIVSNAAGFDDPPGQLWFQDVPPGSTFYDYVQRLHTYGALGLLRGNRCGDPGEPCVPSYNLPYFRPNSSATRAEIAIMVSLAANFNDMPSGQTFEDVPPSSYVIHPGVERLATRGLIGGYPCGGPGEPCMPPNNRPYFRPSSTATRGQLAKMVANAFFPTCNTPGGP